MEKKTEHIPQARALLRAKDFGVLSTLSLRLGGFPFGSVTPYSLDHNCMPILYISEIAQHTKNIKADPRVSLTVVMQTEGDVQSKGRITLIGNMEPTEKGDPSLKNQYFRYFPAAQKYQGFHDFNFWRLNPSMIRYIGGFGAIHWIEAEEFLSTNPYSGKAETRIIEHMNQDHEKDLRLFCRHYAKVELADEDKVSMTGIDGEGFDMLVKDNKIRLNFEEPIQTYEEARAAMVKLVRSAL